MTACSGQQKPASERSESREAKRLMQGVWLDDSESAVFQAKGDTVYYADSTSMPAYFRVGKVATTSRNRQSTCCGSSLRRAS